MFILSHKSQANVILSYFVYRVYICTRILYNKAYSALLGVNGLVIFVLKLLSNCIFSLTTATIEILKCHEKWKTFEQYNIVHYANNTNMFK